MFIKLGTVLTNDQTAGNAIHTYLRLNSKHASIGRTTHRIEYECDDRGRKRIESWSLD